LLELLDNQRFARGIKFNDRQLEAIMVRRLKSEIMNWASKARFPERKIEPILVTYTRQERQVHQTLRTYSQHRSQLALEDNAAHYAVEFVTTLLKKRLFSSPAAFLSTLEKHIESLNSPKRHTSVTRRPDVGILRSRIERVEEEHDDDDELGEATAEALEATAQLFEPPDAQDMAHLEQMRQWAEQASTRGDSKSDELMRWLHTFIKPNGAWSRERVIIQQRLRALLDLAAEHLPERLAPVCQGLMLDQDTINADGYTQSMPLILCRKPHIGPQIFDVVNADTDCLQNPLLCHVMDQPILPPFVARATSEEQLAQQSAKLRQRGQALLRLAEQNGDEERAEIIRTRILNSVSRTTEQYVAQFANTKDVEEELKRWIFNTHWDTHPSCLS
jgi:hypothetical protein